MTQNMKRKSEESSQIPVATKKKKLNKNGNKSSRPTIKASNSKNEFVPQTPEIKVLVDATKNLSDNKSAIKKNRKGVRTLEIRKNNKTVSSEKQTHSGKKWKKLNKLKRRKMKMKEKKSSPEIKQIEKDVKRVQIPKEISNNWKILHKTLLKDKIPTKAKGKPGAKKRIIGSDLAKTKQITENKIRKENAGEIVKAKEAEEPDIWFDGVDEMLLDIEARKAKRLQDAANPKYQDTASQLIKTGSFEGLTKIVAMDCEMVGVGVNGSESMVARVSIVNKYGQCLYDKYVKPMEPVIDYRTFVSGITPENIADGEDFFTVQKEVSQILKGRILVGHALSNDLKVLYLQHDKKNIRDTSKYKGYRSLFGFRTPSLKKLTKEVIGVSIQEGEHNSVTDAQAAMRLYTMYRKQWEKDIKLQRKRKHFKKKLLEKAEEKK
ncbi:RNA exonuclease 4 isoform X2 [Patella vulgata]|nr:RNA exonuclease 4 isoform X2 [Patella vulgata]XP_050414430.2 RNA exonuclease 4 isoform X2 [Patella vulgata]XP_050414431.2 RNA exonuclease 4 isoform X2 [Patella vulgata]